MSRTDKVAEVLVAIPTREQVERRLKELAAVRDEKLAAVDAGIKKTKALAVAASKIELNKERKALQEVAVRNREQIRKDHKRAAAKWNGVLRAIEAEEPEVVVAEVVPEPCEGDAQGTPAGEAAK